MLADQSAEHPATSMNGALYVEDCDAVFKRALEAGAKQTMPLENKFYGDRSGTDRDDGDDRALQTARPVARGHDARETP